MTERKSIKGRILKVFEKDRNFTISTMAPSKWLFLDLEGSRIYAGSEDSKWMEPTLEQLQEASLVIRRGIGYLAKKEYKMLKVGERVLPTDQFKNVLTKKWFRVGRLYPEGYILRPDHDPHRRLISR
jgi:hypothetical protein